MGFFCRGPNQRNKKIPSASSGQVLFKYYFVAAVPVRWEGAVSVAWENDG